MPALRSYNSEIAVQFAGMVTPTEWSWSLPCKISAGLIFRVIGITCFIAAIKSGLIGRI